MSKIRLNFLTTCDIYVYEIDIMTRIHVFRLDTACCRLMDILFMMTFAVLLWLQSTSYACTVFQCIYCNISKSVQTLFKYDFVWLRFLS